MAELVRKEELISDLDKELYPSRGELFSNVALNLGTNHLRNL